MAVNGREIVAINSWRAIKNRSEIRKNWESSLSITSGVGVLLLRVFITYTVSSGSPYLCQELGCWWKNWTKRTGRKDSFARKATNMAFFNVLSSFKLSFSMLIDRSSLDWIHPKFVFFHTSLSLITNNFSLNFNSILREEFLYPSTIVGNRYWFYWNKNYFIGIDPIDIQASILSILN